jgi:acyl carrier protein
MDTKTFIEKFADAVEIENPASLDENTPFRALDEWSSLAYLSVIAMLDEEYDVQIENAEFRTLQTLGDLMRAVESKRG